MKKQLSYIFFFFLPLFFCACKKSSFNNASPNASINVIHAASNLPSVNVHFSEDTGPFYTYMQPISYGSAFEWGIPGGAVPIVIISSADTSGSILNTTFDLKPSGIYSLYLLNESSKSSTLFLEDTIPVHSDSTAGVRFINLSEGSQPMTVNIDTSPSQTEFGNVGYKEITAFTTIGKESGVLK